VVDYWNLRATGTYLFPLALQDYQECANPIRDFGAAAAYPINESITNHAVIIKAPSITDEEQEAVAPWIGSLGSVKGLSMVGWVPHYHASAYVVSELDIDPIRSFESNAIGVLVDGYGKSRVQDQLFFRKAMSLSTGQWIYYFLPLATLLLVIGCLGLTQAARRW
jgi:hypothetical protein